MAKPTPLEWVTVKTTLPAVPYQPLSERADIKTQRLILRPTLESDLDGWHALRSEPEVMQWTSQGKPDPDRDWSRERLAQRLTPHGDKKFEYVICLAETGEFMGSAGCHLIEGEMGWPVIGYMLRQKFWGKGYATELVKAFLQAWWSFPRAEVDLKVDKSTVILGPDGKAKECIVAVTLDSNGPSQKVLAKTGMEFVKAWEEPDSLDPSNIEILYGYTTTRPDN